MTDQNSAAPHQPGVYAKGENVRVASSVAEATALVFDGFALRGDEPTAKPIEGNDRNGEPLDANRNGEFDSLEQDDDADADVEDSTNDENPLAPETDSGLPAGFTPPTPSPSLFTR